MVRKVSISLPEDLFEVLDEVAKKEGISRSKVIARALRMYFGFEEESPDEHPTVLWKLKASGALRLRSPRRVGRRIREVWLVEEF